MNVYFETYGCQMNVSDSKNLTFLLKKKHVIVDDYNLADAVIINTCAIRHTAEKRIDGRIGFFKNLKGKKNFILIIMGCIAQELKDSLKKNYPFIDYVIGPYAEKIIPDILEHKANISNVLTFQDNYEFMVDSKANSVQSFINIIHGCNNFCTYCIVPYVRGREVSRKSINIINSINNLTKEGIKEVILLGQNVSSYGKDNEEIPFEKLLTKISDKTNIDWITFLTSHPKDFNIKLIDVISDIKKVLRYFHIPIQSGSNSVLKLMNRKYSTNNYLENISYLREKFPEVSISTDILVGFPGETDDDFKQTIKIMKDVLFDKAFLFKYSDRNFTKAKDMTNKVDEKVKQERLEYVIDLQQEITKKKLKSKINNTYKMLVTEKKNKKKEQFFGHNYYFDNIVVEDKNIKLGDFINVKITNVSGITLRGIKID